MQKVLGLVLAVMVLLSVGCSRYYVDPGNVGIQVHLYGEDKGVDETNILNPGAFWYNPMYDAIYEFPTFNQQAKWSRAGESGKDESLSFNSVEGSAVNVDVGLSYHFERDKVPVIFKKFRKNADEITHGYLRQRVQDSFNEHASTMKVTDIFGVKKHELLTKVTQDLKDELTDIGFNIDAVSFLSHFRVDERVETSINNTITASQKAIEAENKVKQIEAEAEQAVAEAKGKAEAVLLEAESKAKANKTLAESLTPELVQYEALQKWDGKLPTVSGSGATPFITIPSK